MGLLVVVPVIIAASPVQGGEDERECDDAHDDDRSDDAIDDVDIGTAMIDG